MQKNILILIWVLCRVAIASEPASVPLDRNQSVINTFEVMCNLELPNFSHIDAKATAMGMHLQNEDTKPAANGLVIRHKAWYGSLSTGMFALILDEMSGPKGTATSCAVAAQVAEADAFRVAAVDTLKLPPDHAQFGQDGARSSEWPGVSGPGTTLILRDLVSAGKPSVMLKLVSMKPLQ